MPSGGSLHVLALLDGQIIRVRIDVMLAPDRR